MINAMVFDLLTIFPKIFNSYLKYGLLKQALDKKIIKINIHDLRAKDPNPDHRPYGGGPGMVLKIKPIVDCLDKIKNQKIILLSPKGKLLKPKQYINLDQITLICGRYEGVDERVKKFIDQEVSIGNYVLSGGELPALVIIEAITRLLPKALGNNESLQDVGYPVYTEPRKFRNLKVPEILLSGNHAEIKKYRLDSIKKKK